MLQAWSAAPKAGRAGAFNQAERSYEQNAVVFAHLR